MSEAAREPSEEEKARRKRVHASVMIVLGAIMGACALAAGLIAMTPGEFPAWMTGRWLRRRASAPERRRPLVVFEPWGPAPLARAGREGKLVLLHLASEAEPNGRLMEETTYADGAVAAWVGRRAVAVKADAAANPELLARYGRGPLPRTILILPDGAAVASGGFLTPGLLLPWARLIDETLRRDPSRAEALRRFEASFARSAVR